VPRWLGAAAAAVRARAPYRPLRLDQCSPLGSLAENVRKMCACGGKTRVVQA
jgi:hypothetical protein